MKIKMILFQDNNQYGKYGERLEFSGTWALETMIKTLLERFYGSKITDKVMSYLSERRK